MGTGVNHRLGKKASVKPPLRIVAFSIDRKRETKVTASGVRAGAAVQLFWQIGGSFAKVTLDGPDGLGDVTQKTKDAKGKLVEHWTLPLTDVPKERKVKYTLTATAEEGQTPCAPKVLEVPVRTAAGIIDFGPIQDSHINVAGKPFFQWFNADFFPKYHRQDSSLWPFHAAVTVKRTLADWERADFRSVDPDGERRFREIFDTLPGLDKKGYLTLNEFLALFCIMYIETAGQFFPIREACSKREAGSNYREPLAEDYFFEARAERPKASYNGLESLGNLLAGEQLKAMSDVALTPAEIAAWNGKAHYPHDPPDPTTPAGKKWAEVKQAARECDFYKYRGLGLNQITGRGKRDDKGRGGAFVVHVDPFLQEKFGKTSEDMTDAELTDACQDPSVAVRSLNSFYAAQIWDNPPPGGNMTVRDLVNSDPPEFFWIGKLTNMGDGYGRDLHARATAMLEAIKGTIEAGGAGSPPPDGGTSTA